MSLNDFFTPHDFEAALDAYAHFAQLVDWRISERLRLYNCGKIAFDSDASEIDRRRAFHDIYYALDKYWSAFAGPAVPWDEWKAFDELSDNCRQCARSSEVDMLNFGDDGPKSEAVKACLKQIGPIKPNKTGYPWVAASKFLHFFNPTLFPIYDITHVWNRALNGVFKRDYVNFCVKHRFLESETTFQFNYNYTLMASELMSEDCPELMAVFNAWFAEQAKGRTDPQDIIAESSRYYSTAFEFALLGATHLKAPYAARV